MSQYSVGQTITYKTLDEEYYSRGYGISYETKVSKISEICFRMENGDLITVRAILQAEQKEPKKEQTK